MNANIAAPEKSGITTHYLEYLDGIRGGAALWVVVAHCMIWGGWYWSRFPSPKIAVDIFMVLSGYLMAHQMSVRHVTDKPSLARGDLWSFYSRRFFRIAPAYYASLLLAFVLGSYFLNGYQVLRDSNPGLWVNNPIADPHNIRYDLVNFLAHVTFVFGVLPRFAFSTFLPDWSIGLEMQFYLVFPFLIYLIRKHSYLAVVVVVFVASWLTERIFAQLPIPGTDILGFFPEPSFLLLKLPVFLVGILVADGVDQFENAPRRGACLMLFALLMAAPFSLYVKVVVGILCYLGMSAGARNMSAQNSSESSHSSALSRLLGNRFTRFMADMSYSVYLFHGFFISACGNLLFTNRAFLDLGARQRVFVMIPLVVIGSYALAFVVFHLIERPGIQWGRILSRRLSERANGERARVG